MASTAQSLMPLRRKWPACRYANLTLSTSPPFSFPMRSSHLSGIAGVGLSDADCTVLLLAVLSILQIECLRNFGYFFSANISLTIIFCSMKTAFSKCIGKIIPYMIFILLVPFSVLYGIGRMIGQIIRKTVRR